MKFVKRLFDRMRRYLAGLAEVTVGWQLADHAPGLKGEIFATLRDARTGEVIEQRHIQNLIVRDASILVARLLKSSTEPPHGLFVLAVGTGDSGWDLQNPPAATDTQRSLYSELTRKVFTSTSFVDAGGAPVAYPTKVVDFTTTFTESEAVGPLCEMGLIGGNISSNMATKNPVSPPNGAYGVTKDLTQYETLFNYLTFACINKPPMCTLSLTWRITC